jgi:[methyl-Co(III) methanol-specific corrinoid protein]:coenzyme M methyltransferase
MSGLTAKERLRGAARGLPVDRPPCVSPGGMMNMVITDIMDITGVLWPEAHGSAQEMAELTGALAESGGFENYGVPFCMTVEAEGMGAKVEMGSREVEPHVVHSPLASAGQVSLLRPLDLRAGRAAVVLEAIGLLKARKTGIPVIGNLTGPLSLAGTLVDMTSLLIELRKKPEDCRRLLDFISEQLIAFGNAQTAAGADAVCISEPSGTGEILGTKHFQTYTLTYLNRVLDALDAPVKIVHICGRLHTVYPFLQKYFARGVMLGGVKE